MACAASVLLSPSVSPAVVLGEPKTAFIAVAVLRAAVVSC